MKSALSIVACGIISCTSQPGPIKRQMIGLLEKFDRWDYNGDGYLDVSELKESEQLTDYKAAEIIAFYDQNKDMRISHAEASAGISRIEEARKIVENL